ncbi:MAG TPA: hypothetical protein VFS63_13395 [Pseudolabrys sp.]|nr:hypothetical protein [Pseudolabrys sp.]
MAPGLTPLVALIAVWVAYRQLKLNRRSQRETTAKATFREYLKLAFEHPDLAEGDYQRLVQAGKADKHSWFVGYFLWAAEEILNTRGEIASGEKTCKCKPTSIVLILRKMKFLTK